MCVCVSMQMSVFVCVCLRWNQSSLLDRSSLIMLEEYVTHTDSLFRIFLLPFEKKEINPVKIKLRSKHVSYSFLDK